MYPTKCTTNVMPAAGVTSSHIKDGNPSDDDQDEFSVLLFLSSPLRTKGPKSIPDDFPPFATILYG